LWTHGVEGLLQTVIQIELDRMGGHAHARDLGHLQIDIGVDQIVGEHAAGLEELAVGIQGRQGLVEGEADFGNFLLLLGGRS